MNFASIFDRVQKQPKQKLVVAWAADPPVLAAAAEAARLGLVDDVLLVGQEGAIQEAAAAAQTDISAFAVLPAAAPDEAAFLAVAQVRETRADIVVKGLLSSGVLMRAVLSKETGLRRKDILSHIGLIEFPDGSLKLLTDGGMIIAPSLDEKIGILENAVELASILGIKQPKAALLAAVETINPKMPETTDAALLTQMNLRRQFSFSAEVDGPLAFDNAISPEAAAHKKIHSSVAGRADILLVPNITAGNVLYKSFVYVAGLASAGLIWGARCPVVLTSRADSQQAKLNSIAAACLAAAG